MKKNLTKLVLATWLVTINAMAAPIVGGSSILDETSSDQLETWLGQGDI